MEQTSTGSAVEGKSARTDKLACSEMRVEIIPAAQCWRRVQLREPTGRSNDAEVRWADGMGSNGLDSFGNMSGGVWWSEVQVITVVGVCGWSR